MAEKEPKEKKVRETTTIGIRTSRVDGCVRKQDHDGIKKPRKGQLEGHEAPDTIELTKAQMARLSKHHSECTPSLACISEVFKYKPKDEEEDEAEAHVERLRQELA